MILKIDVPEVCCMTTDEVMAKLAKTHNWTVGEKVAGSVGLYNITFNTTGVKATYDVVNDEVEFATGETGSFFSETPGNRWYCGESFWEYLDTPVAMWGENEDGEYMLYVG